MRSPWMGVLLASGALGCASLSTLHTAKPVPTGETRLTGAGSWQSFAIRDENTADPNDYQAITFPSAEMQMRYGITDFMDVGFKLSMPLSFAVDLNLAVVNREHFAVSIDPSVSPFYFGSGDNAAWSVWAFAPVLVDVISAGPVTLTLSGKYAVWYIGSTDESGSESTTSQWAGGGALLKLRVGERFAIMPEINVLTPIEEEARELDVLLWSGTLGFSF